MANKKKDANSPNIRMNVLQKIASRIQGTTDDLYRSTYYSEPEDKSQLNQLKNDINNSIKNIMDINNDNSGEPNISRLFERILLKTQNDPSTVESFEALFGDNEFMNNLTTAYLDNRWIRNADAEIDEILKYMPKLQEALQTLKDNVLSSDSFSKEYLNLESEIDGVSTQQQFSRNIDELKKKYKLQELTDDCYDNMSKYGEEFVYCVPYTKAIQKLLDNREVTSSVNISANVKESTILMESSMSGSEKLDYTIEQDTLKEINNMDVNVTFDRGFIRSIIEEEMNTRNELKRVNEQSLCEQYFNESNYIKEDIDEYNSGKKSYEADKVMDSDLKSNKRTPTHHRFQKTLDDDLPLPNEDNTSADGLINSKSSNNNKIKDMNGCIVRRLKRDRVKPIIINEMNLGYYYLECEDRDIFEDNMSTLGMVNTITGLRSNGVSEEFDSSSRREEFLRYIAGQLASKIDADFVNKNQELKKEIYYILKYNNDFNDMATNGSVNNIKISYIPPEDIHHLYFDLNEDSHRGISDLELSLIPAKLWVAIYITNCIAVMTRGNDKRVYYVKQSVETNISKTLLKTIDEIKKSNFGIRQLQSINNVLNITGRFNDYIIPRGADGSSPIEFEVMQGQQIEIKTELLNLLEESAINPTGVPIELIQNRQSPEYAVQLTMTNSKFLRFVYQRQSKFQECMNRLYSRIYNIEYSSKENIVVTLPPPLFINITNTNQLITNTIDYCTSISNIVLADEQNDIIRAKFIKDLSTHYLSSYLNMRLIKDIYNKAKQETILDDVKTIELGEDQ